MNELILVILITLEVNGRSKQIYLCLCGQPCSLTEKKKSRVGSVVMPYIMSSTLRRMSTISNASSGHSSGSGSSDGNSSRPASQESVPIIPFYQSIFKRSHHCSWRSINVTFFIINTPWFQYRKTAATMTFCHFWLIIICISIHKCYGYRG